MQTPLDNVRAVLDRAVNGEQLDNKQLLEAGIRHEERPTVARMARQVAHIAEAGGPKVARRYRDHVIRTTAETTEVLQDAVDQVQASSGIRAQGRQAFDPNHPAIFVLKGVAAGRPVPTVNQLTDNGFPPDIAKATHEAAEVAAAAGAARETQIPSELGRQIAYDHPWPEPEDTWSDLARKVPPATIAQEDADYDAIADKVMQR